MRVVFIILILIAMGSLALFDENQTLLGVNQALGHDWYPKDCCSGYDCKEIACSEVVSNPKGWTIQGTYEFLKEKLRPSPDGGCHICLPNGVPGCIFLPPLT